MNNSEPVSKETLNRIATAANAEREKVLAEEYTSCVRDIIEYHHKHLLTHAQKGKKWTGDISLGKCQTREMPHILLVTILLTLL